MYPQRGCVRWEKETGGASGVRFGKARQVIHAVRGREKRIEAEPQENLRPRRDEAAG